MVHVSDYGNSWALLSPVRNEASATGLHTRLACWAWLASSPPAASPRSGKSSCQPTVGPLRCLKAVHLGDGSRAQRLAKQALNAPEHLGIAPGIENCAGYEQRCWLQGSLFFKACLAPGCPPRRDEPRLQQFLAFCRHRADARHKAARDWRHEAGTPDRSGASGRSAGRLTVYAECTAAHGWCHEAATLHSRSMASERSSRWLWPVTEDRHWPSAACCLSFACA